MALDGLPYSDLIVFRDWVVVVAAVVFPLTTLRRQGLRVWAARVRIGIKGEESSGEIDLAKV